MLERKSKRFAGCVLRHDIRFQIYIHNRVVLLFGIHFHSYESMQNSYHVVRKKIEILSINNSSRQYCAIAKGESAARRAVNFSLMQFMYK